MNICPCCGKPKRPENIDGLGTALKPAMELICLASKPLSERTVASNVLRWGVGGLNIDGCRIGTETTERNNTAEMGYGGGNLAPEYSTGSPAGRWPANICHDGSEEVLAGFPESGNNWRQDKSGGCEYFMGGDKRGPISGGQDDKGSAARFFYTAKADSDDRIGSKHPTVKPLDLIQYLCRLITPPKGVILDPFAGTGTTGEAAWREGFNAVLIERETEYQADIRRRMALCLAGPDERAREGIKAKLKDKPLDHGPLFGGSE